MPPSGIEARFQRKWDEPICNKTALQLRSRADCITTARLLASCAPSSGAWLNAIPCASLGLNLDNNAIRVAVGLRLGTPLVLPHQCVCGVEVNKFGHQGLACRCSAGRHLRHNLMPSFYVHYKGPIFKQFVSLLVSRVPTPKDQMGQP